MEVKKAIIPVAGLGSRFLPVTKIVAKELIPILDTPMIYYVVKEAVDAGIEHIIFVCSDRKQNIASFFTDDLGNKSLFGKDKLQALKKIKDLNNKIKISSCFQNEPKGLGHAIKQAKNFIDEGENFAVLLPDDIIVSETPCIKQLMDSSKANKNKSVIGVMTIDKSETHKYGIVSGEKINKSLTLMNSMIEKPSSDKAPSLLATPGRYILNHSIFNILGQIPKGAGGEYQLTDAINQVCTLDEVYAYEFTGKRYDTGQLPGYLEATIDFALNDPQLKPYMLELIASKLEENKE